MISLARVIEGVNMVKGAKIAAISARKRISQTVPNGPVNDAERVDTVPGREETFFWGCLAERSPRCRGTSRVRILRIATATWSARVPLQG
ncbi:hypothetical protein GCM10023346_33700 [Arthrobacter gyeryongensis]|uniref:Uncharacterized protein n=1 Tax=Arthrobacter gyeryongensis TaxID=1650592 RepID=A0ABP9SM27_9MICC